MHAVNPLQMAAGRRCRACVIPSQEGSLSLPADRCRLEALDFLKPVRVRGVGSRYYAGAMTPRPTRSAALTLLLLASLFSAGCATTGGAKEEADPTVIDAEPAPGAETAAVVEDAAASADEVSKQEEGEVPLPVAESEQPEEAAKPDQAHPDEAPREIVVEASRQRHEVIHDLVTEGQTLLRDVELESGLTGKGKKQVLRGRPVAFALWSDAKQEWSVAQIELPRPPVKWKPGRKPLPFRNLTPGIEARHVKGTGAERLMFAFSRNGDPLKVYGRKFPVFDNNLVKRRQWSSVVQTAKPTV